MPRPASLVRVWHAATERFVPVGAYFDGLWLTRLLFQRGLAAIFLIGFAGALNQFPALLGERGLLPAPDFLRLVRFRDAPSLFHWRYSDRLLRGVAWLGIALSALALLGITERRAIWMSMAAWLVLWALYLSIVNVGQTLALLRGNPFPDHPPKLVRAVFYLYEYTSRQEKRESGAWWRRTRIDEYLPPVSLAALAGALHSPR